MPSTCVVPQENSVAQANRVFQRIPVGDNLYRAEIVVQDMRGVAEIDALLNNLSASRTGAGTIFQSCDWITTAADSLIASGAAAEVRVIVGFEGNVPVAALPLAIYGIPGCRIAKTLGDPLAQYSEVLCAAGSRGLRTLEAALRQTRGVDAFLFHRVRDDSQLHSLLQQIGAHPISRSKAPFADLRSYGNFENFLASQRKKSRERARLRRRAEQDGVLSFELARSSSRAWQLAKHALALKRQWLLAQSIPSLTLTDDMWCEALLGLVIESNSTLRPVISAMHLDDRPAAIEIGFVDGATYYAFLGAFDPEFKSWSPTKLVMEETIRWCFTAGIDVYDLLPPDDPYKSEWTNDAVGVADWLVARTLRGKVGVKIVESCLRPAVKRLYTPIMRSLKFLEGAAGERHETAT